MSGNLELIDTLIASQLRASRWQLALAALLLVLGLLTVGAGTLAQQFNSTQAKSMWLSMLGVCASALSAFPIKDLILRREKADALRMLRLRVNQLEAQPAADSAETERITTLLWGSLKTIVER